ncbi:RICIN domain-containing protein [Streptomyces sp. NBC_01597]|uniref:RICIN domain-containing protein n=2 Tax=Streptomyces TaxID=1883 RepID=UPI00224F802B|nr:MULTISPECIES: RICIN domain-containing protein [unclassified Streptomyces]MCX5062467.1 RICIN domain-containing protein [Streptomyces sp. NBC_00452]MCX5291925.1 RICIN domain-containing protein [Streptomyces sp. NBC_00183]
MRNGPLIGSQTLPDRCRTDRRSGRPPRRFPLGEGRGRRPAADHRPRPRHLRHLPASSWTDGFLTGNGEYGAILHGAATLEKVVFNYHRLVLPNGTRTVKPPVIAGRLEGVRDKALAGNYSGANSDFASGWSLRWTQTYHPAYELRIATPGMTTVNDYGRVDDFRTGEVSSSWTDQYGTWTRRAFVSRTATLSITSAVNQDVTLISRRGMTSVTTSATVVSSPLGTHARKVTLAAGQRTDITVSLLGGWFRLVNRRSGKALDVSGASTADGGKIIQYTSSGAINQQWRFLPNADGSFRLAARHSGKVLDSPGGSAQGTQLVQWQDTGGDDQRWKLVDAGGAYHRLVNVGNGWCVDVADGSTADNARVVQWPAGTGTNQQWQLDAL